ncbi:RagB/SusD family nutrient uptake outer membrane protein [Flavobacterium sp. LM4]|uniref:RagB/SusD family nutrient uptake outer membrane protein n=1 Tax=Flavobacterium sp. LM4 TaxID=1938609 RepID=UPI000991F555|nr:RagB/SusD family nutrient uptake outer membrane protein [Flavobacterium sp. LM4]OOV20519.1 RagB/SusD family nutrient uptake outer membrane protein [Flavobacterium sp. LM4]
MITNYKKAIATGIAIFSLISCENFIEVEVPQSQLTGQAVFEDAATATAALSNVYARLREEGMVTGTAFGLANIMGNYADELTLYGNNTTLQSIYNHTIVPGNSYIATLWNTSYGQLYAINAIIEGVENTSNISTADKNKLKGEALFLRAYIHFYLVNCFGEIPYITTTNYVHNTTVTKNTINEINQNMVSDLTDAEALLQEDYPTNERVRANKFVVKAMLARLHLYLENWEQAETYATAVISNTAYNWELNIQKVFLKENPGIIWALHPGIAGLNTKEARTFIFSSGPPIKQALSLDMMNAFEPNDKRKQYWTRTITNGSQSWYHAYKYKKTLNTGTSEEYSILFRLAEQYLIRAEARAELNNPTQALEDLNKVRTRAALPESTATTKAAILEAVMQERKVELFTEQGHRWFDLKRTARAENVLSALKPNWQNTQLLLPIPEAELLLNTNLLPQNTGY